MAGFSAAVEAYWSAPLIRGEVLYRAGALTIVSDPGLADDRRVMITSTGGATIAALSPPMVARVLARPIQDESQLRAALADADAALHPADLGVLTLPEFRGQGLARAVVRESCRYAYSQDYEPQYRCRLDNTTSRALAASAGLTWFANWEVISPQSIAR